MTPSKHKAILSTKRKKKNPGLVLLLKKLRELKTAITETPLRGWGTHLSPVPSGHTATPLKGSKGMCGENDLSWLKQQSLLALCLLVLHYLSHLYVCLFLSVFTLWFMLWPYEWKQQGATLFPERFLKCLFLHLSTYRRFICFTFGLFNTFCAGNTLIYCP